jgi:hypothetical protein
MKPGWFIIFFMLKVGCALSQNCALTGKVTAFGTSEELPGASIFSVQNIQRGTTTDSHGAFEILLEAGDTVVVSFMGFETQRIPAGSIEGCEINVVMMPAARVMQAIEIKAEKIIAEEFTIRKIKKLEIYTNPSAKADPILAANSTPSATTLDESANISLRGGSPAETGIFLNHVPINDAVRYSQLNGIGTFSIFNTALVNNVQVYPGNPPLEYGNSTSGIIALQTDEIIPEKRITTIALTLASTGLYSSGKINKNVSLTVFGNYQPSYLIKVLNNRSLKELRGFSSADIGIHYFQKLKGNAALKIFNYSLHESYRFHYSQPTYDGVFRQQKMRNFTVSNLRKHIGNTALSFNQGISFSKADYAYSTTDIDLRLQDYFASINFHHTGIIFEWKTGVSFDHKSSDFEGTFPIYSFATGATHPVTETSEKDRINNPELYAYLKYYLTRKWIAGAGIRKNIVVDKLKNYTGFQANLLYKATDHLKANFSAGRYFKYQLPQGESAYPVLLSSKQYSIDLAYTHTHLENSVSVFYKRSEANVVSIQTKGIELYTRYRINPNLKCQLSLTSLDASEQRGVVRKPSPYNIHYFVRGNMEYKIQGTWTITTVFLCRQGSYYYPVTRATYNSTLEAYEPTYHDRPERLPAYNTIDISISKIFLLAEESTAVAFFSAGNIINKKNVRDHTYNFDYTHKKENLFSQRTIYFGMVINF